MALDAFQACLKAIFRGQAMDRTNCRTGRLFCSDAGTPGTRRSPETGSSARTGQAGGHAKLRHKLLASILIVPMFAGQITHGKRDECPEGNNDCMNRQIDLDHQGINAQ